MRRGRLARSLWESPAKSQQLSTRTLFKNLERVHVNVPSSWASPSIMSGHWALTTSTTWKHGSHVHSHQTTATKTLPPKIRIAWVCLVPSPTSLQRHTRLTDQNVHTTKDNQISYLRDQGHHLPQGRLLVLGTVMHGHALGQQQNLVLLEPRGHKHGPCMREEEAGHGE